MLAAVTQLEEREERERVGERGEGEKDKERREGDCEGEREKERGDGGTRSEVEGVKGRKERKRCRHPFITWHQTVPHCPPAHQSPHQSIPI